MLLSLFVKKLMIFLDNIKTSVLEFSLKVVLVLILSLKQAVILRMIFVDNIKSKL
jgi:hypothetical protein